MKFRSAGWLTALVIAGLLAYGCITLMNMKTKVAEAAKTEAQLQAEIEAIQEENASLQYAIDNQDDPATIEDIARDRLGLVMPDERIFYDAGE
ncbi:MAG: septum formation initiator family protein [Oscillospiraceae bacterium]